MSAKAGTAGDKCETLHTFIDEHRVEKACEFTHTSLYQPACSFYVPAEDIDLFYELYAKSLSLGMDLYVTEKPRHIGPMVIDLDFRFNDISNTTRRYTHDHIKKIVKLYYDTIKDYLVVEEPVTFYIMEKSRPVVSQNIVKDGIHIIIPDVVTRASVKHAIRSSVVESIKDIISDLDFCNKVTDIVDEAVIEKNNWFMYGSKKVNQEPYFVTAVYKVGNEIEVVECNIEDEELVKILSIRNKYTENNIIQEKKIEISKIEKKLDIQKRSKESARAIIGTEVNVNINISHEIEQIEKLVDVLNDERVDNYNDWIRLGWCLRNIDNRLLPKWIEKSKKSKKFVPGECEKIWDHMKCGGLGVGTLHMWAKTDNPTEYKNVVRAELKKFLYQSTTCTHYDVAQVVHHLFKHEFVCASIKCKTWYEFKNHRWIASDCGFGLRSKISDEVWREYHQAAIEYTQSAISTTDPNQQSRFQDLAKKMNEIAIKLRTTTFKENLMKECAELFYVEKFEEKLDSNPSLIGFNNGVYDMTTLEFREGRPDDFISYTTRNNYVEYNPDHPAILGINNYLSQVLTKSHIRDYVLKLFASFLNGAIKEQKFYIWTGSGSNSKSKLVELFEQSFGDYCCKFPITLLTQKRAASNAATSELARAKGKRFASLQEPSEDEKLNIGLMKELSGGDVIMARSIYKEPIEFKPMFKMLLLCNHLPNVPSDDGGTWRRIRVVEFTSKFLENPKGENEFPIDYELSEKFPVWAPHFMSLLLQYYKHYLSEGACEPQEVIQCTLDYKNQNDFMSQFIDSRVEKKDSAFLSIDEVYMDLRSWVRDNGVSVKVPSKPDLERYLTKNLSKCVVFNQSKGFKGYKLRTSFGDDEEVDLIN